MTPRDREIVADFCARRAGMSVDPAKAYLIENRLAPVARREGFASVHDLIAAMRDRDDDRLAWAVVEAMSPGESLFFRDAEALETVVADLLRRASEPSPQRIWVTACGTGQEAYSVAMLLQERGLLDRVQLMASDLSDRRLETAQAGIYSAFEVQRGLPARRLVRHFENHDAGFALSPQLRRAVRWARVNLLDDLARHGRFDLVICRGSATQGLMPAARERVMANLAGALNIGGRLLLTPGEKAPGLAPVLDRPGLWTAGSRVRAAA